MNGDPNPKTTKIKNDTTANPPSKTDSLLGGDISDLFDLFAFETVKAGQKWEVNITEDAEDADGYPYVLYRIEDDDPVYVAAAANVDALCELVRDEYCNDAENLQADLADGEFEKMVEWAERWEQILESNAQEDTTSPAEKTPNQK